MTICWLVGLVLHNLGVDVHQQLSDGHVRIRVYVVGQIAVYNFAYSPEKTIEQNQLILHALSSL